MCLGGSEVPLEILSQIQVLGPLKRSNQIFPVQCTKVGICQIIKIDPSLVCKIWELTMHDGHKSNAVSPLDQTKKEQKGLPKS